jgi:cation diffusion facilitator family transporter
MNKKKDRLIFLVLVICLVVNIFLTGLKLIGGLLFHSASLLADGLNSLSDIVVSILLIVFIKIARKPRDSNHPYGHEKFEAIIQLILGIMVIFTGILAISIPVGNLISGTKEELDKLNILIAIISLVTKLLLFTFVRITAIKLNDSTLKAESSNHLGDCLASSLALVAIILAQYTFVLFDLIGAILIGAIIIKSGLGIIINSTNYLTDQVSLEPINDEMINYILSIKGVIKVDSFRLRKNVHSYNLDLEISVDGNLTVFEGHSISEAVENSLRSKFCDISTCFVHINPYLVEKDQIKN